MFNLILYVMERKFILSELIQNDKFVSNEELDLVRGGTHPIKPIKGSGCDCGCSK